jgi:hypothetical protein
MQPKQGSSKRKRNEKNLKRAHEKKRDDGTSASEEEGEYIQEAQPEVDKTRETPSKGKGKDVDEAQLESAPDESKVKLNVGGKIFVTTLTTLQREPDSVLASIASGRWTPSAADGAFFIDRNPRVFECILDYLRSDEIPCDMVPRKVSTLRLYKEAQYFLLPGLSEKLAPGVKKLSCAVQPHSHPVLDWQPVMVEGVADEEFEDDGGGPEAKKKKARAKRSELLAQIELYKKGKMRSLDLSEQNLDDFDFSQMAMSGVIFDRASMRHTNLTGVEFTNCSLRKVDLQGS